MRKEMPSERQRKYAVAISVALRDEANLGAMDKWQMRDYISKSLSSEENRKKVREYTAQRHKYNRPWLSDESLGGEWGLDASDFGTQAWGNS